MRSGLIFLDFIIITIAFFIFLFKYTDFKYKFSDFLMGRIDKLQKEIDDLDEKIKEADEKAQETQYNKLKKRMRKIVQKGNIAEVEFVFNDHAETYRIYGFKTYVLFAKSSEEIIVDKSDYIYKTLDELYHAVNMDSICLYRDWKNIKECRIRSLKIIKREIENQ